MSDLNIATHCETILRVCSSKVHDSTFAFIELHLQMPCPCHKIVDLLLQHSSIIFILHQPTSLSVIRKLDAVFTGLMV